jgi:hypothetical protein
MLVKIISTILENTYTTDDLIERLGLMRLYYGKKIFSKGATLAIDDVLAGECEEYTLDALRQWEKGFEAQSIQPIVIYETLDTVKEEVAGMPAVVLYVPVRFTGEHVVKFGTWFRTHVQPNILLTLRVDPRAAGGCSLIWKNTYYNFSMHYYIQRNRDEIVSMVDNHLHAV